MLCLLLVLLMASAVRTTALLPLSANSTANLAFRAPFDTCSALSLTYGTSADGRDSQRVAAQ